MNSSKMFLPFLLCLSLHINAQSSWTDLVPQKAEANYKNYAAILINQVPLWDGETTESPLKISKLSGKLTVGAVDRKTNQPMEAKALGFMIGLKDHATNTIWMISEKMYDEFELEELQERFDFGDVLLIMTVDRTYRLPRHELVFDPGC